MGEKLSKKDIDSCVDSEVMGSLTLLIRTEVVSGIEAAFADHVVVKKRTQISRDYRQCYLTKLKANVRDMWSPDPRLM